MEYEVKLPILGFEETTRVKFEKIDDLSAKVYDVDNPNISFLLINPYALMEYSFDVPTPIQVLLDINQASKVNVYNILVLQKPFEKSVVNFLAPVIFNEDNKTMGQTVLSIKDYPEYANVKEIGEFVTDSAHQARA